MAKRTHYKQPKTSWDDSYDAVSSTYKKDQQKWKSAEKYLAQNPFYTKGSKDYLLDGIYQD